MNKLKKAKELRSQGYNCSQTVFCTYAEDFGIDLKTAWKLTEGLGGGFGNRQGLCGAVNAMGMVLGLMTSSGLASGGAQKKEMYERVNQITERFIEKNGSELCAVLKAGNSEHRSCTDLILDCVELIESYDKTKQ